MRQSNVDGLKALVIITLVGWPLYASGQSEQDNSDGLKLLAGVAAVVVVVVWYRVARARERARRVEARRAALLEKYGDKDIVERIMKGELWQRQTSEQVYDSLGPPVDIDEILLRKNMRRTWKYHPTGRHRFALRVILDNDIVIGWDKKS
jgi:hypothetical protein